MAYGLYIQKNNTIHKQIFRNISKAHRQIAKIEFIPKIVRCYLDNGSEIIADLKRDSGGYWTAVKLVDDFDLNNYRPVPPMMSMYGP